MKKLILFLNVLFIINSAIAQTIFGVDVSAFNGTSNYWPQIEAANKKFAYIYATGGATQTSSMFYNNVSNASSTNVVIGAYHYAYPDSQNDAVDEANHFISVASSIFGNSYLPPALDLEEPEYSNFLANYSLLDIANWVNDWSSTVYNSGQTNGRWPVLYVTRCIATDLFPYYQNGTINANIKLWIADTDNTAGSPGTYCYGNSWSGWPWLFHQYFQPSSASSDPYTGMDLNVFNGDINDFNNLIGGGISTPVNDECSNAITLQSNLNCNYTSGTVDGATPDNSLADASCDNYQYNSLAAGVFYKFTAVSNSHTIFVDPVSDLDPVVALYEGNCNNLTEIDCADIGGGNGQSETINATNLSIGQTYWIRIYDWGNLPPSNGNFNICITHTNTGLPDIIVENESVNPTSVIAGNSINVSCRIRNDSNYDATNSGSVGYYLSTNATYDNSDIYLGHNYFGTLYANDYSDENRNLVIPSNTQTGNYYVLFYADYQENIDEGNNENNNIEPVSLAVTNTSSLTYVPDDNFEQALIDLGYDDVLDNYVLTSNISGITTLNVSNRNISDLTGIEDFTSLEELYCQNNQLTFLNVTQNSNLETLWFYSNQVGSINLSNNLLLTSLNCSQNILSSIDVSSNINLYAFICFSNLLTSIDLSQNPNLSYFKCYSNQLEHLNLKNGNNGNLSLMWAYSNPELSCIQVDDEVSANNGTGVYSNWLVESGVSYSENCALVIDSNILYQNISIYPNPTTGVFYINNPKNIELNNYVVTNSLGQEIKKGKLIDSKINLSNLNSGIYFIKLQIEKNEKITFKIIKQ